MKNYFLLIIILLFISNCKMNNVINHHGVHFLEKKHLKLIINKANKNDVIQLLGPPSTKSTFDNDLWIYIERKTTGSVVSKLGKKKLLTNNVLVLELDNKGLVVEKIFLNKDDIINHKFSTQVTEMNTGKSSFVYNFLGSMREKINDPLGKKRKAISQN